MDGRDRIHKAERLAEKRLKRNRVLNKKLRIAHDVLIEVYMMTGSGDVWKAKVQKLINKYLEENKCLG